MEKDVLLVEEDQATTVALALAEGICPGCVRCERRVSPRMFYRNDTPCPYFHPANFYYDNRLKCFWCQNWTDKDGNNSPWDVPKISLVYKA